MNARDIENIYPLSQSQQGMLFHTLYAPESGVYFYQVAYTIRGPLDAARFRQAWQRTVDRHTVLRTFFNWKDMKTPRQVVLRRVELPFEQHDFRGLSPEEQTARRDAFLEADRKRGFLLEQAPLMRVALMKLADDTHQFIWTYHHLLLDGWSVPVILKDVFTFYEAQRTGQSVALPPARPFRDYVAWVRKQDLAAAEAFWRQDLEGFLSPTRFGVERAVSNPKNRLSGYEEQTVHLSAATTEALRALCRREQLTLGTLLQGAWAILLARYGGQDDVVFGTTVSGRPADLPGVETMVGPLINTLPLRARVNPDEPLLPWLKQLQAHQVEMRHHEYTPLAQIQAWSEVPRALPLFESILVFENYPVDPTMRDRLGGLDFQPAGRWGWSNYPLAVVAGADKELHLRITYERNRFNPQTITRMLGHLRSLLEGIAADPWRPVWSLQLATPAEREELLHTGGAPVVYPRGRCVHELVQEQARRFPDRVAVVCAGKSLTYRELDERANRLANYLRSLGVGPEALVGVYMERSLDIIVALLGILKVGGAYLPMDPVYPPDRLAFMLSDSQAGVLLTQQSLLANLPTDSLAGASGLCGAARTVCLDTNWPTIAAFPADAPAAGVTPDNLVYCIYTSGSTGKPKGCLLTHYNVVRLFQATQDWFHFDENDVWTFFHSSAFDFSVWEIWGALVYGGRLVVVPYRTSRSPDDFHRLLHDEKVTVLNQTPSAFRQLIDVDYASPRSSGLSLRLVIFGGEALELQMLRPWFERHGDDKPQLVNMYGITETTVHVTYRPLRMADLTTAPGSVIGGPIPDLQLYVLDSHLQPMPLEVPGELYVGGAGVARGYLKRPELTAERFIRDPFRPESEARLYKSGDLARRLPGGDMEYLGRIDHQVKIRGFRIELGEIESVLTQSAGVRQAFVIARDEPEGKALVGYLVADKNAVSVPALRAHLKEKLPDYMVPAHLVVLDALPLTSNGKVDRRALPAPERERTGLENPYVGPRTELEKLLVEMMREILKIDQIGVHDNFFDAGGNSMQAVALITRLQEKLGEIVQVVTIFDAPTIGEMAEFLRKNYRAAVARICPTEALPEAAETGRRRMGAAEIATIRELVRNSPSPVPKEKAPGKNPPAVFVLAPPRSGTTLMRVVLGGHPRMFGPPELELLSYATLPERKAAFSGRDSFWLEGTMRAIMEIKNCGPEEARRVMEECEQSGWTTQRFYRQLQEWIGDRMLVDKTPSYALDPRSLRRGEEEFEGALYVHLLRHPHGMIRSFVEAKLDQLFFRHPHPFSREELAELIWLVSHQNILDFLKTVPPERQHQVRFEDLVRDPVPVIEGLCGFLGLEVDAGMLDPYADKKSRMTDGIHAQSRMLGDVKFHDHKGFDRQVAERWREGLDEDFLGDETWQMAETLGYVREAKPAAAARPAPTSSVLVPIQSKGSKPPLFCVHPLGGHAFCFVSLTRHLDPDRPLYGLQARGLYNNEQPDTNLEVMAGCYIDAIRQVQPEGPYLIAGWSMGGIICYEMARQLQAQGQEVGLTAILDTTPYLCGKAEDFTDGTALTRVAQNLRLPMSHLGQFSQEEQWSQLLQAAQKAGWVPPNMSVAQLRPWIDLCKASYKALADYKPGPYPGHVTLLRATEADLRVVQEYGPDMGWRKLAGGLSIVDIPCDHSDLLREPHVKTVAGRLEACIQEALAKQPLAVQP